MTEPETAVTLYAVEHARGLHRHYAPPGCPECQHTSPQPTGPTGPTAQPGLEPPSRDAARRLHAALEAVRRGFVVDQPDEPEHGPTTPDGNPWCEACHGARLLAIRSGPIASYVRCPDCLHASWAVQQRVDRLLGALPPRFAQWRLDTFPTEHPQQRRALELVQQWLDDASPSWLFVWGPTGRGKTGLSVGLLHTLALRGHSVALRNVPDLLTTIKSSFSTDGDESESSILEVLASVDVLCLDDLGAEYHRGQQDWAAEKVFQVVAARHAALKRTIITSNSSLEQLQDTLGHPRTLRRIVDMTGARWIVDVRGLPLIGAAV